jgi:hypothetical protein
MATSVFVAVWLEKIGLQSLSPIFQGNFTNIFRSKILIHSLGTYNFTPFTAEIIFMIFFSGGSGVLSEVNSGGGGWNFFLFLLVVGGGV